MTTPEMQIRNDLPIPQTTPRGRTSKYGLDDLDVGEALIVSIPEDKDPVQFSRNLAQVKAAAQKRTGNRYALRRLHAGRYEDIDVDSVGIWRVE